MCKKLLIAGLSVLVAVAVIRATGVGSHLRLWKKQATSWAKSQVSPETEIQRLRMEVERLERDDKLYFHKVAEQRLQVKARREKLEKDRTELTRLHKRVGDLRAALQPGEGDVQQVSYNGASYTRADVEKQIDLDWTRYKPLKAGVAAQERGLKALEAALAQNEQKLFSARQRRQEMLNDVQELENELNELRQARAANASVLDDSSYGEVQRSIQGLRQRLAVEKEKLTLEGAGLGGPIEQAESVRARRAEREKEMEKEFGKTALREHVSQK